MAPAERRGVLILKPTGETWLLPYYYYPDGLPLLLRKQPIWAAGDTPHLMPVEQGLPWPVCPSNGE